MPKTETTEMNERYHHSQPSVAHHCK